MKHGVKISNLLLIILLTGCATPHLTFEYDFITGKGNFLLKDKHPLSIKRYDLVQVKIINLNSLIFGATVSDSNIVVDPNPVDQSIKPSTANTVKSSSIAGIDILSHLKDREEGGNKEFEKLDSLRKLCDDSIASAYQCLQSPISILNELQALSNSRFMAIKEMKKQSTNLILRIFNDSIINSNKFKIEAKLSHENANNAFNKYAESYAKISPSEQKKEIKDNRDRIDSNKAKLENLYTKLLNNNFFIADIENLYNKIQNLPSEIYTQTQAKEDVLSFDIKFYEKPTKEGSAPTLFSERKQGAIVIPIRGGVKVNMSIGIGINTYFNKNKEFSNKDSIIRGSNSNVVIPSLNTFIHFYKRSATDISWGGTFGFGYNLIDQNLQFCLGPSLLMGKQKRAVLTAGINMGKTTKLKAGYNEGDKLSSATAEVPTLAGYSLGYFVGLSFNISGLNLGDAIK